MPALEGSQSGPAKLNQDHIRVVQAIYGILISLALRQLVEGIPTYVSWIHHSSGDQWRAAYLLLVLICSSTLFLALRFFFIPHEISNQILFYLNDQKKYSRRVTLFHYPMVVIQGSLLYAVCDRLKVGLAASTTAPSGEIRVAIWLQAILLLTNAIWLLRFAWLKAQREKPVKVLRIYFLVLKAGIVYVVVTAKRLLPRIGAARGDAAQQDAPNWEAKWSILNTLCGVIALIVLYFSNPLTLITAIVVFALFTMNSLLDLYLAADFYVPDG